MEYANTPYKMKVHVNIIYYHISCNNYNLGKLLLTTAEYVHVYMQSCQEKMIVFDFFAVFVMASVHRVVVR